MDKVSSFVFGELGLYSLPVLYMTLLAGVERLEVVEFQLWFLAPETILDAAKERPIKAIALFGGGSDL